MGGTLDIFPSAVDTPPTAGWVATGGTLLTAVNDASDASYISDTTPGTTATKAQWALTDTSLPTGSAVKYMYPMVRYSQAAGTTALAGWLTSATSRGIYSTPRGKFTPSSSIQENNLPAGGASPQSLSQETVNNAKLIIEQYLKTKVADDHRVYRAWMRVQYIDSPTAQGMALSPSNANTLTTRPTFVWAYDSPDGLAQYEYRVALWKLSDINLHPGGRTGFETNADTYVFGSGFTGTDSLVHTAKWTSGDWVASAATQVTPDVDLDGSSSYVYYVQVSSLHAGERLRYPDQVRSLDFTQSITTPAAPTSVTPTWNGTPDYKMLVAVPFPSATLGSWDGRKLLVQRRMYGSTLESDWMTLPGTAFSGTFEVGASSGTYPAYDQLAPPTGRQVEYRAKLMFWSNLGYTSSSAWVVSSPVTPVYDSFVLRDPFNPLVSPVLLKVLGDFEATTEEEQGVFQPLGAKYPIVVSDRVMAKRWNLEVRVKNLATQQLLENLREAKTPMVLQTDMDGIWYWVRFGRTMQQSIRRQTDRVTATKREQSWHLELIQIDAPLGQPRTL